MAELGEGQSGGERRIATTPLELMTEYGCERACRDEASGLHLALKELRA